MQAIEWASKAPFTVIAFVIAKTVASDQEQEGHDLYPRVDNYIVVPQERHMNSLKKAVIRFLTNSAALSGKKLPCLVSPKPHAALLL